MAATRRTLAAGRLSLGLVVTMNGRAAAASAADIDRKATLALEGLYARNAVAKTLGETAKAVLVFPDIVKDTQAPNLIGAAPGHSESQGPCGVRC